MSRRERQSNKSDSGNTVEVQVLSHVSRRLITGPKSEFIKSIGRHFNVEISSKTGMSLHVKITGLDEDTRPASAFIREMDQKAVLLAEANGLHNTGQIHDEEWDTMRVKVQHALKGIKQHNKSQEQKASAAASAAADAPDTAQQSSVAEPGQAANDEPVTNAVWKPKPRALTIKFNTASFQPRNLSQAITYFAAKDFKNSYVFAAGPFGGGKTFTPLRAGCEAYNDGLIDEILLIRPPTTTGKDPGAMPGGVRSKQDPYLKGGLASNIEKMLVRQSLAALEKAKVVRAFTPDFERGETYDHAFILVDEPQNLTIQQAELLIGRLGEGSIMVFAGDIGGHQSDLKGQMSGLVHLIASQGDKTASDPILDEAMAFIEFKGEDSAARNKILPHVNAALKNLPEKYAAFLAAATDVRVNPRTAEAIEGGRLCAEEILKETALRTTFRYESQIQQAFPELYKESRAIFQERRPELKVA